MLSLTENNSSDWYSVNEINQVNVIHFIDLKTDLFYFCLYQDCSFNKLQTDYSDQSLISKKYESHWFF